MRAIGIDLGTTNSAAAVAGGREIKVLPTRAGEQLTPSVVGYSMRRKSKTGEIVVGRAAVNNAARDPLNTIFSIKRLMGRVYGEPRIDEVRQRYAFRIADPPPPDDEDQGVRVILDDKSYSPVDISAQILAQIKADAELALGETVTHAVITVPAYFEERMRKATSDAAEKAGLKVITTIDEPTAAAFAYGLGKEEERHRVLVFDFGGGTFDISVIQMTAGHYSVLEIQGDNWLGGDDFDQTIVERMVAWVEEEYGHDLSEDASFLSKAKSEAQKAKIALDRQERVELFAPLFVKVPNVGPVDIDMEITLEDFENDIGPMVDRTVELVREALRNQDLGPDDITEVLLVGGSTSTPLVQRRIREIFGEGKVKRDINPMECVAKGAAILAAEARIDDDEAPGEKRVGDVFQVTPMHLGIAAVRGDNPDSFVPIIPKGTPYPLVEPNRKVFYPTEDNQTLIRVPVYEGISEIASLNEQQGVVEFPLPEGLRASTAVEVAFNYDRNRLLTVSVRVLGTDHFIEEQLRRDRPRVRPANEQSLMDDWREELQPAVRAGQNFLEGYGEYMSDEDTGELREAIAGGERALEANDQINGKKSMLMLRNKIMGSGTASQLFIAERAMHGASAEVSQQLGQAVAALRAAHAKGDEEEVQRLATVLKLAVAQLLAKRSAIQAVEDKKDWDALLRDKDGRPGGDDAQ